ncbi:MAG: DUF2269 family protein [Thermoleophilaceae bacterium]
MLATVDAYNISLWLHISAVVVGFGATFAEAITFPVALKMDPRHLPYVHRLGLAINRYMATPALVLILATGIFQVAHDGGRGWSFGDFWISATFAIVIVLGGMNGAYFIPEDRRLEVMVAAEIAAVGTGDVALSETYLRRSRTEGIAGAVAGVLVIVAVFLMVTKPGA